MYMHHIINTLMSNGGRKKGFLTNEYLELRSLLLFQSILEAKPNVLKNFTKNTYFIQTKLFIILLKVTRFFFYRAEKSKGQYH